MWRSLEWWKSLGFEAVQDTGGSYLSKTLPNGWELCISDEDAKIPESPPINRELGIALYEPNGEYSGSVTFTMQRQSALLPDVILSTLVKALEAKILT